MIGVAAGVIAGVAGVTAVSMALRWRAPGPRVVLPDGRVGVVDAMASRWTRLAPDGDGWALQWQRPGRVTTIGGHEAERVLRSVATSVNLSGGSPIEVAGAVALLDATGGPERFLVRLAQASQRKHAPSVGLLPPDVRIAMEMALHEETERRALAGELAVLEEDWRLAEEIAAIADDLLLPDVVRERLRLARARAPA
jgi:hypothetical protein